jgi:hypothetical protein
MYAAPLPFRRIYYGGKREFMWLTPAVAIPCAWTRPRSHAKRPFLRAVGMPQAHFPRIYKIRGLPFCFFLRRGISATELLR